MILNLVAFIHNDICSNKTKWYSPKYGTLLYSSTSRHVTTLT